MNLQKLRLGQLKATGTTVGDVYFPQTKLLLPFNGANGATTTSDLSNTNASVTFSSGDEIRTAQSKFGNSSLYIADNVTISSSDGFNMETGDFTIEGWYYFTSFGNYFSHYDQWAGTSTGAGNVQMWNSTSSQGKIKWYYDGNSYFTSSTTMSTGQWYHVAYVRESGTLKIYFNGTVDSNTQSYSSQFGKTGTLYFGDQHASGGTTPNYYIDDLRITKGVARYTGNFTAPTTAHLTSAGDVNKQIIINSAADGVAIGTGGISQARLAKAWVNFNGTGTVAINGSYNVSSITDDGTGDYDINFSTALSDTNYVVVGTVGGSSIVGFKRDQNETRTTSKAGVYSLNSSSALADGPHIEVIIFGN